MTPDSTTNNAPATDDLSAKLAEYEALAKVIDEILSYDAIGGRTGDTMKAAREVILALIAMVRERGTTEVVGMKSIIAHLQQDHEFALLRVTAAEADAAAARKRVRDLEAALKRVRDWSRAYPIDVFPEPDFKRVRELLEAGGISLDAVSASNMRHAVEGVGNIAINALRGDQE